MAYIYAMNPRNRLRILRKLAGLSQAELARLSGVSQPAISQVENDERPLTTDWMRTFGRIIGCAPADLLPDDDVPYRLNDQEMSLVEDFRNADDAQRAMVMRVAEPMSSYRAPPRKVA